MSQVLFHIGRSKRKNQLFIDHKSVSSIHAQIIVEDGEVSIVDLNSSNGTYINYKKIDKIKTIEDSDIISFGSFDCTKKDLLNAAQKFEYKNNVITNNIKLISSINSNNQEEPFYKKHTLKIIVSTLILLCLVLLASLFYKNQNHLKSLISNPIPEQENETISSENVIKNKPHRKQKQNVTYDFSCLSNSDQDNGATDAIIALGDLTKDIQSTFFKDVNVSLEDEVKYGEELIEEIKKENKLITSGKAHQKLKRILNDIESRIVNPRGFNYEIFFVDDSLINVFTSGGKILFYKGMYDFVKNDSELAVLLSHEIAHNELGHMTLNIKKLKESKKWGGLGQIVLGMERFFTTSFNQKQEAEADLFGIDLVYPTNYISCSGISLFDRLSKNENEFNLTENLFRSHPYSKNRAKCLNNHLSTNYNKNCNE
jgi:metalloendopeptidase OMA1, mitochondrial